MKRVIIIGGGVIGLCSAYYLARGGHAVTVLERNPEDFPGCSFGNAGRNAAVVMQGSEQAQRGGR